MTHDMSDQFSAPEHAPPGRAVPGHGTAATRTASGLALPSVNLATADHPAAAPTLLGPPPPRHAAVLRALDQAVQRGLLRAVDAALASFIAARAPQAEPRLVLAAALASAQVGAGHACLDLGLLVARPEAVLDHLAARDEAPTWAEALTDGLADGQAGAFAGGRPAPHPLLPWLQGSSLHVWRAALAQPGVVGHGPGLSPLVLVDGHVNHRHDSHPGSAQDSHQHPPEAQATAAPPSLRLYLRRYWQHETTLRQAIAHRLHGPEAQALAAAAATPAAERAMRQALSVLFPARVTPPGVPDDPGAAPDFQPLACALAARSGFAVVTGGPGTGKTTTVVRLLALLQHLALQGAAGPALQGPGGQPLRIRLAAPTGKAAARLNESIAQAVSQLPLQALAGDAEGAQRLRAAVPTQVSTVHRLLGVLPQGGGFRHHARHPLPLDVLVIDEASMLDLGLAAAVVEALPPGARLLLLGDKDQLASVEAGAVLGDLCRRADGGHHRPELAAWLARVSGQHLPAHLVDAAGQPLDQAIVKLRHSHRFGADSAIGRLAAAVNAGDPARVRAVLAQPATQAQVQVLQAGQARGRATTGAGRAASSSGEAALRQRVVQGYGPLLGQVASPPPVAAGRAAWDAWALGLLQQHTRFQLLAVLRQGPWGVQGLNSRCTAWLRAAGLLAAPVNRGPAGADDPEAWFLGRPVMVTRNTPALRLMNGDVGLTLALPGEGGRQVLRVAFPAGDGSGGVRWVLPSRLTQVSTVWAMTVHKSQGSEFAHAALVLPDRPNPVLTRELVYTAITRAKEQFTLVAGGDLAVLDQAVQAQVLRLGGLAEGLAQRPGA